MIAKSHWAFSLISSAVVVTAIVWGVMLAGSPTTARLQRFDRQRLIDLQTIHREVQRLCWDPDIKDELKRPLPKSLVELAELARNERINTKAPESGEGYGYEMTGESEYELSATFSLARDSDVQVFWNHQPGRQRFIIDALDPP